MKVLMVDEGGTREVSPEKLMDLLLGKGDNGKDERKTPPGCRDARKADKLAGQFAERFDEAFKHEVKAGRIDAGDRDLVLAHLVARAMPDECTGQEIVAQLADIALAIECGFATQGRKLRDNPATSESAKALEAAKGAIILLEEAGAAIGMAHMETAETCVQELERDLPKDHPLRKLMPLLQALRDGARAKHNEHTGRG